MRIVPGRHLDRRVLGGSILVVMLALAWLTAPAVKRWSDATATVPLDRLRLATVSRGDLVRDVSVQGRVVAAVSPTLYATAAGTITLHVEAGAAVTAGQVLALIDSPELENELRQAESALQQQTVELERQRIESRQLALDKRKAADLANVALVAANREKRRADEAHALRVISVIDFEKAQDDLSNAELAHAHAQADADLFDERLAFELKASELQRQVDRLSIRSPVDGIVGDLLVAQKSAVARDTPVMAVVDLTRFEVDAQVPESYADDLGVGMAAEVLIGGATWPGRLVAVSPEVVDNQVTTRIRFDGDTPSNLRQNQRLMTRILLEERPGVLMLARGQFLDSGGGRIAYVLDDNRVLHRRTIALGARSLAAVEIESGLAEGETVVISGIDRFDGAVTVLVTD